MSARKSWKKRLLWVLIVFVVLFTGTYLLRRPLFESTIRSTVVEALQDVLGGEVTVGAIHGNWLTHVAIDDVTIRCPDGAVQEVEHLDLTLDYSLFALAGGDLSGLERFDAKIRRVVLHTAKDWTKPAAEETPSEGPPPTLAELLGILGDGATIEIGELVLAPGYLAPGAMRIDVPAGSGTRQLTLERGKTSVKASIDAAGAFTADVQGDQGGRLLRELDVVDDAVDAGVLRAHVKGSTKGDLTSTLDLLSKRKDGSELHVSYEVERKDGRFRAPKVHVHLPAFALDGEQIELPIDAFSKQAIGAVLKSQKQGRITLDLRDLERHKDQLPKELHDLLPIRGKLELGLAPGEITVHESTIRAAGAKLTLTEGSLQLPEGAAPEAVTAEGLGFVLELPEPRRIPFGRGAQAAGRITGSLSGTLEKPSAKATVALRRVDARGLAIATLDGTVTFDGDRIALTGARIAGKRSTDDFALQIDGSGSFELSSKEFAADIRGAIPKAALALAPMPEHIRRQLAVPGAHVVAKGELQGDGKPVFSTAKVTCKSIQVGKLAPIDLELETGATSADTMKIESLALVGDKIRFTAGGTIDLAKGTMDVTADGTFQDLPALCALLQQPTLGGRVHLTRLTARGPFRTPETNLELSVHLDQVDEEWLPPRARAELPTAPLDLELHARSSDTGLHCEKLDAKWGRGERRIHLKGAGPLPLEWTGDALAARAIDTAFVLTPDIVARTPTGRTVKARGAVHLTHAGLRIPELHGDSNEGHFEIKDLQVDVPVQSVLADAIDWPKVGIKGTMELHEVLVDRITDDYVEKLKGKTHGQVDGKLTLAGSLGAPSVVGYIDLVKGRFAMRGYVLEAIQGKLRVDDRKLTLDYTASGADTRPFHIEVTATNGDATWAQVAQGEAALDGQCKIDGLDLAQFRSFAESLPKLHGAVSLHGRIAGTVGTTLRPEATLVVRNAGWQLPDSDRHIEGLNAVVTFGRGTIELTKLEGTIPGLDRQLDITGRLSTGDSALWEFFKDKGPAIDGFVAFKDLPLDVVPREGSIEAASGIATGRFDLAGTWAKLQPKLEASIHNGALKIKGLPRIDQLEATLTGDAKGTRLRADAAMGAGPVAVEVTITPGEGELLDAYQKARCVATVKGKHVLVVRTGGLKVRGDIDLLAQGPLEKIAVTGNITLDDTKFVKRLSLVPDLKVSGGAGTGNAFGPWSFPGGDRFVFDVELDAKEAVIVRTNVLDADVDVSCRLQGQGTALHLAGACTSRRGTIRFPGMSMRLSGMRLMFPKAAPPRPELLATASGQRHGIRINMNMRGPWNDPVITLSSNPALQPRELWSLATTGQRPASLAENSAASNTAILATYVIQELLLTYIASESTEASESFVSRFTFEFGREISRDGAETWEVNFDMGNLWYVPSRFGLRFERDVYEDFNLGVVYRWRF